MKKSILFLLAATIFMSACSEGDYTQLVFIKPTSDGITKSSDGNYIFENEDIKISYTFWAEHGILGFEVYNKTDHPLYIDWKKSSMINDNKQFLYFTDKTSSNFVAYGKGYSTKWTRDFNTSKSETHGAETVVKEERISFISPHSYINKAFYNLTANIYFDISRKKTEEKNVHGVHIYISKSDFAIQFRNYLSYSDNENFSTEKHIDNGFEIDKIYTMKTKDFGKVSKRDGLIESDWKSPSRFYVLHLWDGDVKPNSSTPQVP